VRTLVSVVAYWSWAVPRLRRYCHLCDLPMWGWQACVHPAAQHAIGPKLPTPRHPD